MLQRLAGRVVRKESFYHVLHVYKGINSNPEKQWVGGKWEQMDKAISRDGESGRKGYSIIRRKQISRQGGITRNQQGIS